MSTEGLDCWDDYPMEHGCICGNDCEPPSEEFCDQCFGPYTTSPWLMAQYGGHWDTCPNRHNIKEEDMSVPEIKMNHSLDPAGSGYHVELDGQRFTQAQWEAVQSYVNTVRDPRHKAQRQNEEFHTAFGIETPATPRAIPADQVPVVIELIREEFIDELIPALGAKVTFTNEGHFDTLERSLEPDVVEIYDALIDILYVVYGALNRAGMNAEPGYDEVQASNMSKLGEDGKPIIAGPNDPDGTFEGRVKKGPNYFKPNLERILREQGWEG